MLVHPALVMTLFMQRALLRLLLLLAACAAAAAVADEGSAGATAYRLNTGDVVRIQVFGEADLSPTVRIDERGRIPYPFLGELAIAGLTTQEVEGLILEGLKGPYLVDPRVNVTVDAYRPVYVNGEVRTPGSYAWEPGMTVRKVVALAGGLSDRASTRRIFLVPENADPATDRLRVELDAPVAPGDVVTIEQSFF